MSEDQKNKSLMVYGQTNSSSYKSQNTSDKDFMQKKLSKQSGKTTNQKFQIQSSFTIGINGGSVNWVPQKKDKAKKQIKKGLTKDSYSTGVFKVNSYQIQDAKHDREQKLSQKSFKVQTYYEDEEDQILKSVQKQMSLQNQSANQLLGFTYQDEDYSHNPQFGNTYNKRGKRRGGKYSKPTKDYNIQSALKFIVKHGNDYLLNLYDPNENIDWKDVVKVTYNMINASDVQCPICLENLPQMVAPKITKCGHIYCWPCVLQYLAFEKDRNWKRCPLCNEPVYKHELKNVQVNQSNYYKVGQTIQFNLMARSKANVIVKDKSSKAQSMNSKIYASHFPNQNEAQYHQCRILMNDKQQHLLDSNLDLEVLQQDQSLMMSSHEFEKIPYILEALEHCQKEINKINSSQPVKEEDSDILDFEENKRRHNKKLGMKKPKEVEQIEENSHDFFYFYQAATGENLYLHPLCLKILQHQYPDFSAYPLQIEAQVLEINQNVVDKDDREFQKYQYLNHLPDGVAYGFIEVDMCNLVDEDIYQEYEKQISNRERHRKRKLEKEENYAGKVETFQNEKFEQIKQQALNSLTTASRLQPGVVRNNYFKNAEETKDEESTQQHQQEEVKDNLYFIDEAPKTLNLWNHLGDLLNQDYKTAQATRKDTLEGAELSQQAKKALEAKKSMEDEEEFACKDDAGFNGFSSVVIMQGKAPKKLRKRRH